jgi:hypothetical protein
MPRQTADVHASGGAARRGRRRGIVCVIAMVFLMLFVILAMGFYAATAMSSQLANNERATSAAQVAAESGMQYVRYHMACLDIPADKPADQVFSEVYRQLKLRMIGTGNLGTRGIGYDGRTITIPSDPTGYIVLNESGSGYRAQITDGGPGMLVVKVTGSHKCAPSGLGRAIEVEYVWENWPSPVFDYAVASRGKVQLKSTASTNITGTPASSASVLSTSGATPSIVTGGGPIDGGLGVMVNKSQVSLGGGAVGGMTDNADILARSVTVLDAAPPFPSVDTTVFKAFATNVYSGATHQKNVRVPPNTNPSFRGGDVVDGVLYIESPNNVVFSGSATINGLIVFENKGTPADNVLDFRGNVSPAAIPDTAEFAALRLKAKGLALAAPTAAVTMSGSVNASVTGTVIANRLTLGGSADLVIRQGSLISLGGDATTIEGKTVHFDGNGKDNAPYQAIRVNTYFRPNPSTYREVPQ